MNLKGWEIPILLFVILLLFGARRLPELARSVGKSMRILKDEVSAKDGSTGASTPTSGTDDAGDDQRP